MTPTCVLVFAKYPQPGRVKTRMVPPLTAAQAADLHRAALVVVFEKVSSRDAFTAILVGTPDDRLDVLAEIVGVERHEVWAQGDGDLGERLVRAGAAAFARGFESVVFLGADSPTLPDRYLEDALALLTRHDAVIGPCCDGGYYLLALSRPAPALFEGIDWGGSNVTQQTCERGVEDGLSLARLPEWYDLDRFDDLSRARRDLLAEKPRWTPAQKALYDNIHACLQAGATNG